MMNPLQFGIVFILRDPWRWKVIVKFLLSSFWFVILDLPRSRFTANTKTSDSLQGDWSCCEMLIRSRHTPLLFVILIELINIPRHSREGCPATVLIIIIDFAPSAFAILRCYEIIDHRHIPIRISNNDHLMFMLCTPRLWATTFTW